MLQKSIRINRRQFTRLAITGVFAGCVLQPFLIEPYWLRIRKLNFGGNAAPTHRIVHITDIHYKGNRRFFETVVHTINDLAPDCVCFSGDLVERKKFLTEALEILQTIQCPVYGVPGNHEYKSGVSFPQIAEALSATGGKWLVNQTLTLPDRTLQIIGMDGEQAEFPDLLPDMKHVLLVHYPEFAAQATQTFDLSLVGHSHGGQIRLPLIGPIFTPNRVGAYSLGLFRTQAGPLYVNPGIGTLGPAIRVWCRPEIVLIEI
jgi:uncharacterized protein